MKLRKILSLLVAMIMTLGCVGISAMAEESETVTKIGETTYASLADAINNADAGQTVTLVKDVHGDGKSLTISKDITLDLGGYTFTDAYIITSANVTIKNGSIKNTNESYPIKITKNTLTVENITLEASKSDRAIWVDSGTLNFYDSSILATKGESNLKSKIYGIWVAKGTTANIYSGSITVDAGPDATAVAIFGNYVNNVNVYDGKISTSGKNYGYAIWTEGDVTVTGGEIVTNEKKYGYSNGITYGNNYAINTKGNVTISGGTITTNGYSGYLVNAGGSNQQITISDVEFTNVLTETDKTAGGHKAPQLINGSSATVEISGGQFDGVAAINPEYVASGATITVDGETYIKTENGLEETVVAAKIGDTTYATLEEAFKAATDGCTIEILDDVVIDYKWDSRYTGSKFTVPVTINGNNHKLTFNGVVNDGFNQYSVFRFEESATVNNLTVDMTNAISEFNGRFRAISAKSNLTVDGCKFIGNGYANNTRAIIYGEGAGAEIAEQQISIINSEFEGWRRAISDNETGKTGVNTVVITGNTVKDADICVSAENSVTMTDNVVEGGYVDIRSYTANNALNVTATGNTLKENTETKYNYIKAGGTVNAQKEFVVPIVGTLTCGYAENYNGFGRIWGEATGNPKESVKLELYSGEKLIATTKLNDRAEGDITLITGGVNSYTWSFLMDQSQDVWWTTTWETGQPNALAQPDKVVLYIDDVEVAENVVKMTSSDNLHPIEWKDLIGVKEAVLPNAEVTNLGMVSVTANDGNGDYKFGTSYYVYDLVGNQKLTTATAPFDLNVAMQFVAKDSEEDAKANAYAEYTTDFFIKIDGIQNGSFVGNGCYLAGYYPSFEAWVKIPLDGFTVENGKVYPVISSAGFDFSYVDICTSVEDFICGIYLTPEILAANPGINVNLTLGLSENIEAAKAADFETVDEYTYDADDFKAVAQIGTKKYSSLDAAIAAANAGDTITLLENIELTETVTVAKGQEITLDLNEKTITGTDTKASGNYELIANKGTLTVKDSSEAKTGTITLTAETDRAWNAYSAVIANLQGTLTVESGIIKHLGGTSMAYAIDNNTNGNLGNAILTVSGGTIESTYRAIRQFANSSTCENTLTITGGTISGDNRGIWLQSSNAKANIATTTITGGSVNSVYVWAPADADVSALSLSANAGNVTEVINGLPEGYEIKNTNGIYGIVEVPEVELFDYYGSSATLGSSLAMNFYVADSNLEGTDYYAEIKHYAEDEIITTTIPYSDWTVPSRGYHMFTYSNLAARQIADKLEVTIYTGDGTQVSVIREDSLRAYAFRGFAAYANKDNITDKESKTLTALVDMLNYGAAAQVEFGYNTENPANADTEDYQQYATESVSLTDIREMDENVYGTSLTLKDKILLSGYFSNITEGMYAKVQFADHYGNEYDITVNYDEFKVNGSYHQIVVDELAIADAAVPVTITIYDEQGNVHSKLVESVNSYLSRAVEKYGNDTIYEKIAKFALSALNAL